MDSVHCYHLCVRADEAGLLCAGRGRPYTVHRLSGGQTQGLAAAEGSGGQAPFSGSAAVVWDAECTALVVVQTTSCRGQHISRKQEHEKGRKREVMKHFFHVRSQTGSGILILITPFSSHHHT